MDYIFKDWEKKMSAFESSVEKDLNEIRKCKADMQKMREQMHAEINGNYYVRDMNRIILSAPEIILGNVDPDGVLYHGAASKIILRGTDVDLLASGGAGQVEMRAASIRQIAEDPGSDGQEHVVGSLSEVVSQARSIVIQSDDAVGTFSAVSPSAGCGVRIHTDKQLEISATLASEKRGELIDQQVKSLEARKNALKEQAADHKESFANLIKEIGELMKKKEELVKGDDAIRSKYIDVNEANAELETVTDTLAEETRNYSAILSMLSETNRMLKCLKDMKSKIKKGDDYKKKSTGSAVTIQGESISLASVDGDGNLRDNDGSGISLKANKIDVASVEEDGKLKEKGQVCIQAKNVEVTTAGRADAAYDDKGVLTKATYTAEGDFTLKSKNISIEGLDYEVADSKLKEKQLVADSKIKLRAKTIEVSTEGSSDVEVDDKGQVTKASYKAEGDIIVHSKTFTLEATDSDLESGTPKEKALAAGSKVAIRAEKLEIAATDTEGKATGSVSINAKDVSVKAMDTDKDSHEDKALAGGGTLVVVGEKVSVGAKSKDMKSKTLEAMSEDIKIAADNKIENNQGDGKSVLKLDGNASIEASKTKIGCDTEVSGEVKAQKGTFDKLEAKMSFKSMNIQDGM